MSNGGRGIRLVSGKRKTKLQIPKESSRLGAIKNLVINSQAYFSIVAHVVEKKDKENKKARKIRY